MRESPALERIDEYDDLLDGGGHRWRGRVIGLAVLAALIAAGAYALWALVLGDGSSTAEETETATVERGSITTTVSTSGTVVAQSTAELSFSQSGTVSAVDVTIGQEVKQGDVLAELESEALARSVTEAELNLASAQIRLNELLKDPDEAEVASAEQGVAQAQTSLDQAQLALDELLAGPTEIEVLSAEQAVALAEGQLAQAEEAEEAEENDGAAGAEISVEAAQLALDEANARLEETLAGASEAELAEAQGKVDTATAALAIAQAQLNDVLDGADVEEIETQENQVRLAELSLEKAQEDLEDAGLVAPFDGTVAALNIEVGEVIGGTGGTGSEAAIVLNTPDEMRLDLTVTESDVLDIEVGQSGIALFDALGDTPFLIVIDSVGMNATTTQGVVTYEVRASILTAAESGMPGGSLADGVDDSASPSADVPDAEATAADAETDAKPLPGMNVSVTITLDQAQDVLVVPASAVQTSGDESFVEVQMDDGSIQKVEVEAGLSDGTNTEIARGLEEGQTVLLPSRSSTSATSTADQEVPETGLPEDGGPGDGFPGGAAPGGMP